VFWNITALPLGFTVKSPLEFTVKLVKFVTSKLNLNCSVVPKELRLAKGNIVPTPTLFSPASTNNAFVLTVRSPVIIALPATSSGTDGLGIPIPNLKFSSITIWSAPLLFCIWNKLTVCVPNARTDNPTSEVLFALTCKVDNGKLIPIPTLSVRTVGNMLVPDLVQGDTAVFLYVSSQSVPLNLSPKTNPAFVVMFAPSLVRISFAPPELFVTVRIPVKCNVTSLPDCQSVAKIWLIVLDPVMSKKLPSVPNVKIPPAGDGISAPFFSWFLPWWIRFALSVKSPPLFG